MERTVHDLPYPNQRGFFVEESDLCVSSPTSHTHFPGRLKGFPNISSPSPSDLGVKGTTRVASWFQQSHSGRRLGLGEGGDRLRSGGEVCWKSPASAAARGLKTPSQALFGRRKWAAPGLLAERPTRDGCADEVVELVPARRAHRPAAGRSALPAPSCAILCSTPESPPPLLLPLVLSLFFFKL